MMRAYRYHDFENLDHIRIREEEKPQPQRGESCFCECMPSR